MIKYLPFFFTVSFFFFLTSSAHATVIISRTLYSGLTNGLVGHWTFDGADMANVTAFDRSGNNNRGILTNGPTKVAGKIGQALNFDGSDDYVDAGAPASLNIPGAMTICAWIKTNVLKDASIVGTGLGGGTVSQYQLELGPSGELYFTWNSNSNDENYVTPTGIVATGIWYHSCGVRVSDSSVNIYLNSVSQAVTPTGTDTTIPTTAFGNTSIGQLGSRTGTDIFDGLIDDVRIYNRVLSADEIKRLYKMGGTLTLNKTVSNNSLSAGLVGHWTFDGADVAGMTAFDKSGNNNRGILTNGPTKVTGKIGQGLSFDGGNDYMVTNSTMSWNSSVITLSFWLWWDVYVDDDDLALELSPNCNNTTPTFFINPNSNNDPGRFAVAICGSTGFRFETFTQPSAQAWHHYVFILDNTTTAGSVRAFVDGVEQATTIIFNDKGATGNFATEALYFMSRGGTTLFGAGKLDDVRAYNRALSTDEIKRLYKMGGTLTLNKTVSNNSLSAGLVGHWTFDGADMSATAASDRSGNGYRGVLSGTARAVGKIGQALKFDGVDDYIDTGSNFMSTNPLTISAWVYARGLDSNPVDSSGHRGKIIGNGRAILYAEKHFDHCSTTCFVFTSDGATNEAYSAQDSLPLNQWMHVVLTRTSTGVANFYLNGVSSGTSNQTSGTPTDSGATNVFIGNDDPSNRTTPWDGLIDDPRVYNRVLSADEIKRLYNLAR